MTDKLNGFIPGKGSDEQIREAFGIIAEYLISVKERQDEIYRVLGGMDRNMTMQEMADYWHISVSSLRHQCRYLLPRFGEKLPGSRRFTCTRGEFMEHAQKGRERLRNEYERRDCQANALYSHSVAF